MALRMLLFNNIPSGDGITAHASAQKLTGEVLSLTVEQERNDMIAIFHAVMVWNQFPDRLIQTIPIPGTSASERPAEALDVGIDRTASASVAAGLGPLDRDV
jgi:hypothetical protein